MNSQSITPHPEQRRPCPACGATETELLAALEFGDFDGPSLGPCLALDCCVRCGQIYNQVPGGPEALKSYYENETLYAAQMGVGSGGSSRFDTERYAAAQAVLEPLVRRRDLAVFDVGCAKGGFLKHLKAEGFTNLFGVDLSSSCVQHMKQYGLNAAVGSAGRIPFDGQGADVLIYSNILEHLYDVRAALVEARRKLKDDGLLYIELPDASRYAELPVFDFYWLSQKEHINHFGLQQLEGLLRSCGFEVAELGEQTLRISEDVENPFIYAVARKSDAGVQEGDFSLADSMREYLHAQHQRMAPRRQLVADLVRRRAPVYPWGIGLEFFCLYTLADLRSCRLKCLVDNNPAKQCRTVNGLEIVSSQRLAEASADEVVVITSALHKNAMAEELDRMGFRGEVVFLT